MTALPERIDLLTPWQVRCFLAVAETGKIPAAAASPGGRRAIG